MTFNSLKRALLMPKQSLNHIVFKCLLLHTLPTSSNVEAIRGVQMGPGATALTLMPLLTNWLDSERVNAICRWGRSEECNQWYCVRYLCWSITVCQIHTKVVHMQETRLHLHHPPHMKDAKCHT
jgi:hypothetical protein